MKILSILLAAFLLLGAAQISVDPIPFSITGFTDGGVPAAGASGDIWQFDATLAAMDSDDTVAGIVIGLTNADHTGSSNVLMALEIEDITGDAQASEYAINIGDDFDTAIRIVDTVANIDIVGSSGTFGIRMGASGTANMALFRSNPGAGVGSFTFQNGTGQTRGTNTVEIIHNAQAQDGSDTDVGLMIDLANADHTGVSNEVDGIKIDAITADADALEYGIYVDDGWEGIRIPSITQANLAALANGSIVYCSDCNPDATCTALGTGAFAFRIGGAWACELN